jgi:hypothetical protein
MKIGLILLLTACSSIPQNSPPSLSPKQENKELLIAQPPEIPFDRERAFFPLRINIATGNTVPSYQWRVCVKRFVVCLKWEAKTVYFEDLEWFRLNSFGLSKRRSIIK